MIRIILLPILLLSPATAQDRPPDAAFHRYDKDGDGLMAHMHTRGASFCYELIHVDSLRGKVGP